MPCCTASRPRDGPNDQLSVFWCRVLGGSQYVGLKTLVRYTCFTTLAGFVAWQAHPYLLDAVGYVLDLNWKECATTTHANRLAHLFPSFCQTLLMASAAALCAWLRLLLLHCAMLGFKVSRC